MQSPLCGDSPYAVKLASPTGILCCHKIMILNTCKNSTSCLSAKVRQIQASVHQNTCPETTLVVLCKRIAHVHTAY